MNTRSALPNHCPAKADCDYHKQSEVSALALTSKPLSSESGLRHGKEPLCVWGVTASKPLSSESGLRLFANHSWYSLYSLLPNHCPAKADCDFKQLNGCVNLQPTSKPLSSESGLRQFTHEEGNAPQYLASKPLSSESGLRPPIPSNSPKWFMASKPLSSESGLRQYFSFFHPSHIFASKPLSSESGLRLYHKK